jgi:hypothetical protein
MVCMFEHRVAFLSLYPQHVFPHLHDQSVFPYIDYTSDYHDVREPVRAVAFSAGGELLASACKSARRDDIHVLESETMAFLRDEGAYAMRDDAAPARNAASRGQQLQFIESSNNAAGASKVRVFDVAGHLAKLASFGGEGAPNSVAKVRVQTYCDLVVRIEFVMRDGTSKEYYGGDEGDPFDDWRELSNDDDFVLEEGEWIVQVQQRANMPDSDDSDADDSWNSKLNAVQFRSNTGPESKWYGYMEYHYTDDGSKQYDHPDDPDEGSLQEPFVAPEGQMIIGLNLRTVGDPDFCPPVLSAVFDSAAGALAAEEPAA